MLGEGVEEVERGGVIFSVVVVFFEVRRGLFWEMKGREVGREG